MNGLIFQDPVMLIGIIVAGLIGVISIVSLILRLASIRRFYRDGASRPWAQSRSTLPRVIKSILCTGGLVLLAIALARPSTNPQPQKAPRSGRDVVFVIDVSRSMLAQDVRPNRLERAKLGVRDVLDVAEGDRIGLVAFAGGAVVKCPLTTDYAFVRLALDDVLPGTVGRGGTAIGDAIRTATALLVPSDEQSKKENAGRSRTIILITDGEDHESQPIEAAKAAGEFNIRVVTIGVGSEVAGAPVPADVAQRGRTNAPAPRTVEFEGREVLSRMNPDTLRRVAESTPGGVFLNVGTSNIELDETYRRLMKGKAAVTQDTSEVIRYTELFQLALALALAFLFLEFLIDARYR